jgi:hypothetical protein
MTYPTFASGDVLNASDMNAVGLWLVKSQTVGSGVSSVTVTGAFSADYDNYKILYTGGVGSTASTFALQLKTSGGSVSSTGYFYGTYGWTYAGAAANANGSNAASFAFGGAGDPAWVTMNVELQSPFGSRYTVMSSQVAYASYVVTSNCVHALASSYADFTITPSAGTLTGGTIRVYGYRN